MPDAVDPMVIVMAKSPVPGRVKTRLCPPLSPVEAAEIAAAALADTLEAVASCRALRKVVALDGEPGPWLPPGFQVIPQRGESLAERLSWAWADVGGAGIQIGMDTPQVTGPEIDDLLALLAGPGLAGPGLAGPGAGRRMRAVLGLALDGGWWAIGLPACDPSAVFAGVPMSSPGTGAYQRRRLVELGFDVRDAATRRDIDTVADLVAVAASAPSTRTAATARRLGVAGRRGFAGVPS